MQTISADSLLILAKYRKFQCKMFNLQFMFYEIRVWVQFWAQHVWPYWNNVTTKNIFPHVLSVTVFQITFAMPKLVKQYSLIKYLNETGPKCALKLKLLKSFNYLKSLHSFQIKTIRFKDAMSGFWPQTLKNRIFWVNGISKSITRSS